MKIHIDSGAREIVFPLTGEAGPLLAAMDQVVLCKRQYKDGLPKFVPDPEASLTIESIPDSDVAETPEIDPALVSVAQQVEVEKDRWLKEYRRANDLEKELKELKAKVAEFTSAQEAEEAVA